MAELFQKCSVCSKPFHVQFSYQMEESRVGQNGQTGFVFFCSHDCAKQGANNQQGLTSCDACGTAFRLTHAAQVMVLRGRRHYACGAACRKQLLGEAQGVRLGQLLDSAESKSSDTPPAQPFQAITKPEQARQPSPTPLNSSAASPFQMPAAKLPSPNTAQQTPHASYRAALHGTGTGNDDVKARASQSGAPRVIAVFNHKGGTGKTTTAVTIAAGLAARGKKTLLVDTDAQGNVAVSLGLKANRTLYHVLVMGVPLTDAVCSARPNLDVLASNETLAAAELYLAGRKNRDRVLNSRLLGVREQYDYVIVDCSPSLSLLNQNALVFVDAVLCPVACDYLSLVGVRQVVKTIKNVNRLLGHPVQLWGVLPTLYDRRARICREALETLQEHFGPRCLEPIRSAIRVKEAPSQGETLLEYAADSSATTDYNKVIDKLTRERQNKAPFAISA